MKFLLLFLLSISIVIAVDKEDTQLFTNATITMEYETAKSEIVYFGTRQEYLKNYKEVLESNVKKYSATVAATSAMYVASTGLRANSASAMDLQGGLIGLVAGTATLLLVDYIDTLYRDEEYMFVSYVVNEKGEQGLLITLLVSADDLKFDKAKVLAQKNQNLFVKGKR